MRKIIESRLRGNVAIVLLVSTYVAIMATLSVYQHQTFNTGAYDLGLYTQAIWKLAFLKGDFNTIRGMSFLGDHLGFVDFLIAPIYRLFPHPETLLILQAGMIGGAAFFIFRLAFILTGGHTLFSVLAGLIWLLQPALQFMNQENFHPEAMAVFTLLGAFERAFERKWKSFFVFFSLSLLFKEDIPVTTAALGVWIYFSQSRKVGLVTVGISAIYFLISMKVLLPYFNQVGFFRNQIGWFANLYAHRFEFSYYRTQLFSDASLTYLYEIFAPFALVCFAAPSVLAIGLPALLINILSGIIYLESIHYHYNYGTLPFFTAAAIIGIVKLAQKFPENYRMRALFGTTAITLFFSFYFNYKKEAAVPFNFISLMRSGLAFKSYSRDPKDFEEIMALIPEDTSLPISATYTLVPHLANRTNIYMFPNPFIAYNYGVFDEASDLGKIISYLVIDETINGSAGRDALNGPVGDYIKHHFVKALVRGRFTLWQRKN